MARRPDLQPEWLCSLLVNWGRHEFHSGSRMLGYPSICPMLKTGIPSQARSFEPTGYTMQDWSEVEAAIAELPQPQQLAVVRYCMPWRIQMIDQQWPADDSTWLRRLKAAFPVLAGRLMVQAA